MGRPLPYGATVDPEGINFSIGSKMAEEVTLLLYKDGESMPMAEIRLDPYLHRTGDIWHIAICGLEHHNIQYAYKMDGPWEPEAGHRFDPNAILLDPYARSITGAEQWGDQYMEVSNNYGVVTDSTLRCRIETDGFDWKEDNKPNISMEDLIIYEAHTRGFTRHSSSDVEAPGTYKGLIEKLPYLKSLGINAVELMPVSEFFETEIARANPETGRQLLNYWGYSTIAFFAPKASYAASGKTGGQIHEFKELVRACHAEGIEVILDVVFNHTAEGDHRGPTISFRGIDNDTYYMLSDDGKYLNFSGCGNTINCNHPVVREMIRDCLRYWVMEMRVDGFRFDLASILGRDSTGKPLSNPPLIELIALDPILANCKLIAEAWDAGGLYQIGSFCAWGRWGEWNGKYRDTARRFLNGYKGQVGEMAKRISGSPDLYQSGGRYPYHSINFITCHDGFTLRDLFSYNEKHNEANGEENRDGSNDNWSFNHGVEGPTDDPDIEALRLRKMKNAIVLLMVSLGVPMLYEGDEMARTKNGNNNTYCHDDGLNWINWGDCKKNSGFHRFVRKMINFRKNNSALRRKTYYTGKRLKGTSRLDIEWHSDKVGKPDWTEQSRILAFTIGGPLKKDGLRKADIYIAFNSDEKVVKFNLPRIQGRSWRKIVDTSLSSPEDFIDYKDEEPLPEQRHISLEPGSSMILVARRK